MTAHDDLVAYAGDEARFVDHGEAAIYTPLGSDPIATTVDVDREPLGTQGPDGLRVEYKLSIKVRRNVVDTVTIGADTVALKKRKGDASNTTYTVTHLADPDDGSCWILGLN